MQAIQGMSLLTAASVTNKFQPSERNVPLQSAAMRTVTRTALKTALPTVVVLLLVGLSTLGLASTAAPETATTATTRPALPVTEAKPVSEVIHGVSVTDSYRWLEDQNSPETRDWIRRENAYTDAMLGNLPQKPELAKRIEALLNTDVVEIPVVRGTRYFYRKRPAGEDTFRIYMRQGLDGAEQLLVDPTPLSPKHTTNVDIEDVSHDGRVVAYHVREGGADETEVHFYDVEAKSEIGMPLARARYEGVSIAPDDSNVFYTAFTDAGPRVFHRRLQTVAGEKLFGDGYGPEKIILSSLSDDGRYLLMTVLYGSASKKTEIYLKDVAADGPIQTVVNDVDARFFAHVAGDSLVIQTNWNAPNERLMIVKTASPTRQNWHELVPERKNAAIQGLAPSGGKLFVRYLENVKPRIVIYGIDGQSQGEIAFDTIGRLGDMNGTWTSPVAFYSFSSFNVPTTIYAYVVGTCQRSVFARTNAPVKSEDFTVEQVWYPSRDGTKIPMFLMYKKGLKRDGTHPTHLTGYGGFNVSQIPAFISRAVVLAEHGGVYALANLRGGSEFGEAWHQAGMLAKKQNVFDDFLSAAEYLVKQKYTSPKHLSIGGTSNGGLLVTAALTQRPDLFKAVFCGYPLVDMLRYDKFLVAGFWVPEYGSASDPEQFKWIYAYSPYQHVTKGAKYPATLFVTGDADTRVAPLHARKMAALMQASTGSTNPVLIRYHESGGHSGGEPLSVQVNNEAEILAFLLAETK
jgi:prolyl oligopeptidase